jgi:hypothetical protein
MGLYENQWGLGHRQDQGRFYLFINLVCAFIVFLEFSCAHCYIVIV